VPLLGRNTVKRLSIFKAGVLIYQVSVLEVKAEIFAVFIDFWKPKCFRLRISMNPSVKQVLHCMTRVPFHLQEPLQRCIVKPYEKAII
jgi:hypothetical protein